MSSPIVSAFHPGDGGHEHRQVGLAAGAGERGGDVLGLTRGVGELEDEHVLGQPAIVAGHHRGDAQCEALLAEQRIAAVARAVAPDFAGGGEVHDVLVVGVARPGDVLLAGGQRGADAVQAWHPLPLAEHVERALAHAGHDAHARRHIGAVGQLHPDVRDPRGERAHAEGHDVHRAALHRSGVELGHLGAHLVRGAPVVGGAGVGLVVATNEGAIFHAGDVARVAVRPIAVRPCGLVELGEGARGDQRLA